MTLPSHGFLPIRFIREADFPEEISATARFIALNNLQSAIFGQKRGSLATNRAMSRCRIRVERVGAKIRIYHN